MRIFNKRKDQGLKLVLLLFCFTAFFTDKIFATHIIGGEMTYVDLGILNPGVRSFAISMLVYRDCDSGTMLDNPAHIGVYSGSLNSSIFEFDMDINYQSVQSVPPVIPPCADASAVNNACVQRGIYSFQVDLPILANESYFIVYQRCCRTNQIINISNPGDFGGTYMVELTPEIQANGNNSPTFVNYPPTFICNNFALNIDHSATDADGDSLTYEFCTPLAGGGPPGGGGNNCDQPQPNPSCGPPFDNVVFLPNFSQQYPMGGLPLVQLNPITGLVTGTPNFLGQYVVGICVKEYRNGVLIGSIFRDFQFNTVDCTPTVFADIKEDTMGILPQTFIVRRCGEKAISIINQSPQSPDLLTIDWVFDLGNGNIYNNNNFNLVMPIPDYGIYHGILYLNRQEQCADTAYITVYAYPEVQTNFVWDYDICRETPIAFQDSSTTGAPLGIQTWAWEFGSTGGTSDLQNPEFRFPSYNFYNVKLKVTDQNFCSDSLTKVVVWNPELPLDIPDLGPIRVCLPGDATFNMFDSLPALNGFNLLWDFGDGSPKSTEPNPIHHYDVAGKYTPSIFVNNSADCSSTDTFANAVTIFHSPNADFEYTPDLISNLNNTVNFYEKSDSSAVWVWDFGTGSGSREKNPIYAFQDTGLVTVQLTIMNEHGCLDSVSKVLDVVPLPQLYIPNAIRPTSTDGVGNEKFGILGILPGYSDFKMQIWGRWGEHIFETVDPNEGWDGRRKDGKKVVTDGVYIYLITMHGPRGEPIEFRGTVTVF